jgi:hypothetical protein
MKLDSEKTDNTAMFIGTFLEYYFNLVMTYKEEHGRTVNFIVLSQLIFMNNIISLILLDVAFVIDLNECQWSVFGVEKFFICICMLCLHFNLCVIRGSFILLCGAILS